MALRRLHFILGIMRVEGEFLRDSRPWSASVNYLLDSEPQDITINMGRDIKDIISVTVFAGRCLVGILYLYNHINHLDVDLINQILSSGFNYEVSSLARE